ncbi:hypothetical protein GOP47_0027050 [Adiantum capillus-veneris]|nr:hypothetical protein GOP47_0027050 [Adiantum capillus-veneris]
MELPAAFPSTTQRQNAVLFVPPLRVVAPPGVLPYLPQAFDPFFVFQGFRPDIFRHNGEGRSSTPPPPASQASHAENGMASENFSPASATFSNLRARFSSEAQKAGREQAEWGPGNAGDGCSLSVNHGDSNCPPCIEEHANKTEEASNTWEKPIASESEKVDIPRTAPCEKMDFLSDQQQMVSTNTNHKKRIQKMNMSSNEKLEIGRKAPTFQQSNQKKRNRESKSPNRRAIKARAIGASISVSPHEAVIKTLRLYDALRHNLLLEEESKGKDASKGSRPDLQAGSIIQINGLTVNRSKKFVGPVPGVEVGDQFYFRMELCCVGMHGPIQGGIEYLTTKESEYKVPVATSIISSGGYDAMDTGEELVYTGQGGKSAQDGKSIEDQKLERGNLALENSMKHEVPVRVTRGIKDSASPSGKTYTYDGLYKVEQCWSEKGKFGFEEYKYKLCRLPGQPNLGSAALKLSNTLKYKPNTREGLLLADVAGGREGMPVCLVNTVDDLKGPSPFEYATSLQYPQGANYEQYGAPQGCNCTGACNATQACSCFSKNGHAFAYLNNGILVKERSVIYECGSNCQCSFSCRNRSTQKALKFRLEVFRTGDRGWGLRSWDTIPAGSFICEFTGKLIQSTQLPLTRDYVLDAGRFPKVSPSWGDASNLLNTQSSSATAGTSLTDFIVDSSHIGNVSRFINHSCSPNILVQSVLRDHQDTKRPHLMLFAMDNIPPFKELTRNYGSDSIFDVPGKQCLCKSENCKGKFYE